MGSESSIYHIFKPMRSNDTADLIRHCDGCNACDSVTSPVISVTWMWWYVFFCNTYQGGMASGEYATASTQKEGPPGAARQAARNPSTESAGIDAVTAFFVAGRWNFAHTLPNKLFFHGYKPLNRIIETFHTILKVSCCLGSVLRKRRIFQLRVFIAPNE
jgi:hypothetical protein